MKNYEWVLFDADKTLFHFDDYAGLQYLFSSFGSDFTEWDYRLYQDTNKPLWEAYQNGRISAQALQCQRFDTWAKKLQVSPQYLNNAFLAAMAEICTPLEGAASLLTALKGKARLGIITNGFIALQEKRLQRTGFKDHFELIVISEQVGIAKPDRGIFDHALSLMGHPERAQVLMVGDNPESDILGGINAGLDTCWLNADNKSVPTGIVPQYQVSSLKELESLLIS